LPELTGSRQAEAMRDLGALGVVISDLGASASMHETGAAREQAFDEGRRFIGSRTRAARPLRPDVRRQRSPRARTATPRFARVVDGFREMSAYASKAGVTILMESHGDFTHIRGHPPRARRRRVRRVRDPLGCAPHVSPRDTKRRRRRGPRSGKWVRHTAPEGLASRRRRSALRAHGRRRRAGEDAGRRASRRNGYTGYYCFEWEKKWHPEIEDPEVAFPHYAKTMTAYLEAAGVKPR
jgi:hypothetical protein